MKKLMVSLVILSLLLPCCLCFTGCGGADKDISKADWNAMLSASNFENYTLTNQSKMRITDLNNGSQMTIDATNTMKFANGKLYRSFVSTINGETSTDGNLVEGDAAKFTRDSHASMFAALKYELFDFDSEKNQYVSNQSIEIPVLYTYYGEGGAEEIHVPDKQLWENVVVEVSDGKLMKITYDTTIVSEELGTSTTYNNVYILSDYGTTKL